MSIVFKTTISKIALIFIAYYLLITKQTDRDKFKFAKVRKERKNKRTVLRNIEKSRTKDNNFSNNFLLPPFLFRNKTLKLSIKKTRKPACRSVNTSIFPQTNNSEQTHKTLKQTYTRTTPFFPFFNFNVFNKKQVQLVYLSRFVLPVPLIHPPNPDHVPIHSKSLSYNIAPASGGAKNMHIQSWGTNRKIQFSFTCNF